MYRITIQLHDLTLHQPDRVIHEIQSKVFRSIQEAFESIESGQQMFQCYLEIESEIMKDVQRILNKGIDA